MSTQPKAIVIGAGFAGLSAATCLAHHGWKVTILEKNNQAGGRARRLSRQGFHFDMGPSWYWMPDVFERYFRRFGKRVEDYYTLQRLDPSYRVVFGKEEQVDIPARMEDFKALCESYEPGSSRRLEQFLQEAAYKYEVGVGKLVYKPSLSIREFIDPKLLVDMLRMQALQSFHKHVRKFFKHPKLIELMEFPILFLGATPKNTPALYSLMNYADVALGTWYPMGGMYSVVEGMLRLAQEQGVEVVYGAEVEKIDVQAGKAHSVHTAAQSYAADVVIAGADYHHVEAALLEPAYRQYSEAYWQKRTMAPSALLYYLGVSKKIKNLRHHVLFFDEDFEQHAHDIYTQPQWPREPLFYLSASSITDPQAAPAGKENLVLLIPIAAGLNDTPAIRARYFEQIMKRLEYYTGENIRPFIEVHESYAGSDFIRDYHAFKGNAYGLANTLKQTAIFRPRIKSKKVSNLYFTGQLTVPGPGVPPALISGQVVADYIRAQFEKN